MSQRDLVAWSEHARAGHDVGGPLRRHPSELERLQAENARLWSYVLGSFGLASKRQPQEENGA